MSRYGHDRAGPVLHQHVVGDEHRDVLAAHRVAHGAADPNARLLALGVATLRSGLEASGLDVGPHLVLVLGAGGEGLELRVLGSEDEEGGAEERVRAGREDREVQAQLLAAEGHPGALGAADPVALHRHDVVRPGLEDAEVVQQAIGVIGDPEEPLLEVALDDQGAAPLAMPVDHLLVREHRLVLGAPLHRRLGAVGEAALVQAQEDPLGPAVVLGLAGGDLTPPVDRDAPGVELLAEVGDRPLGRQTAECSPVLIAAFSAGRPNAS